MTDAKDVRERITEYLSNGGLFNPELMDHAKVRDLLIDFRDRIDILTRERDEARKDAARVREASPSLHAAASDLRHMANGGSCSTDTLNAHADALLDYASTDTRVVVTDAMVERAVIEAAKAWEAVEILAYHMKERQNAEGALVRAVDALRALEEDA
jgi:hypothetical protein